ncbi:copper resistance protein CopC [Catenuloplanes sp. NPDC051500]|uniref:copper resistance protein CopC n=1 Tax=Catenuloplanes sp. NPDC051500 TaxID=3363959 RepID=UPI0037BD4194
MTAGRLLAVTLTVAALAVLPAPPPAHADDRAVVATTPADGAALAAPPATLVLRTGGWPDPDLSHVTVQSDAGTTVDAGDMRVDSPRSLLLPIRLSGPGTFTAVYHVELRDGREGSGVVRFSVGTGIAPPTPSVPAGATGGHEHGIDGLSAVLLTVDLLVLAGALLMLVLRPRPGTPPADRPRWRLDDTS